MRPLTRPRHRTAAGPPATARHAAECTGTGPSAGEDT